MFLSSWVLALAFLVPQTQTGEEEIPPYPWELYPIDAIYGHLVEGMFREPIAVTYDAVHDELLVADSKQALIGIYDSEGIPLFAFGGAGLLIEPRSLAVNPRGHIHVQDPTGPFLKVFNYRGEPQEPLGLSYPAIGDWEAGEVRPGSFEMDREGRIFVADLDRPQVVVYGPEGEFERVVRSSKGGGKLSRVQGVAVSPNGVLAVVDFESTPVQMFGPQGEFLRGFGKRDIGKADFTAPVELTFDEDGYLYVVDMLRHDVKVFDLLGNHHRTFGGWFGPETKGRSPGEMLFPVDVAIGPGGLVYVAERFGGRVQIFRREPPRDDSGRPRLRIPRIPGIGSGDQGR